MGKCPLCRTPEVAIRGSHVMPKWSYRRVRDATAKNPNPMVVANGVAIQSSKQAREYMLCDACEQRLGRLDDWASRVLYQADGSAPLLTRTVRDPGGWLTLTDEDADNLARFCLSILWRAHTATSLSTSLGAYGDVVRDYLMASSDLPPEIVPIACFYECSPGGGSDIRALATTPASSRNAGYHQHRFALCGLDAIIAVGRQVPAVYRKYCLIRSTPRRVLLVASDTIIDWLAKPFAKAVAWRHKRGLPLPFT